MAYYLVRAKPKAEHLAELAEKLRQNAFVDLRPFGQAVTLGLNGARWESPGVAIWEEEDYCSPPLAMERAAVLDRYFADIHVERVQRDEGWQRIEPLPRVFGSDGP
jgi:hypothetical protein